MSETRCECGLSSVQPIRYEWERRHGIVAYIHDGEIKRPLAETQPRWYCPRCAGRFALVNGKIEVTPRPKRSAVERFLAWVDAQPEEAWERGRFYAIMPIGDLMIARYPGGSVQLLRPTKQSDGTDDLRSVGWPRGDRRVEQEIETACVEALAAIEKATGGSDDGQVSQETCGN